MKGEAPVDVLVEGRRLRITNLSKEMYPGFTKREVLEYYTRIAPVMLTHSAKRPVTQHRFVHGVTGPGFYEKHVQKHAPDWLRTIEVPSMSGTSPPIEFVTVGDLPTLVWAANLSCIEFHVPLWHAAPRRANPGPPDYVVFDLDPGEGMGLVECCVVATHVRAALERRKFESRPKTSGSKGLQVYAPAPRRMTWDRSREVALEIAHELEQAYPRVVVSNMRKALRTGRVLIDWSQNHPSKTTVCAYSLRARPTPSVSTPVTWQEVEDCARSGDPASLSFSPAQVLDRVETYGDLFAAG